MAYYNYKHVRDQIPAEFQGPWEKKWKEETGREYEGTCDYDGELWILASDYIDHLHAKIKTFEGAIVIPPGNGRPTREGLHKALDCLTAVYIGSTGLDRGLRNTSIMDLIEWSHANLVAGEAGG
jgi:hypothetical protein